LTRFNLQVSTSDAMRAQGAPIDIPYAAATRDGWFAETIGRRLGTLKPGTFRSNDELAGLAMTTLALTKELRL